MADVFLSYAREDRDRVAPLVDALVEDGRSVWWDRDISPGASWDEAVEAALRDSRCVVVVWSRNSIGSQWVRTEAMFGLEAGSLVPALIDDVELPLAFRRTQAADLVTGGAAQLVAAVAGMLGIRKSLPPASASVLSLDNKPSIAILPFRAITRGEDEKLIADALAEDVASALGRVPDFLVASGAAAFAQRDRLDGDPRAIGTALGVEYLVLGTVRAGRGRIRIDVQLVETDAGTQSFSQRFEGDPSELFDFLDQTVTEICAQLEPNLRMAPFRRSHAPSNVSAWALCNQALIQLQYSWSVDLLDRSEDLLERARQLDPDLALIDAGWSYLRSGRYVVGYSGDDDLAEALRLSKRAFETDHGSPLVLYAASRAYLYDGQLDIAEEMLSRALSIAPHDATILAHLAHVNGLSGRADDAYEMMERCYHIAHRDPRLKWYRTFEYWARYVEGDFDRALECALDVYSWQSNLSIHAIYVAGCLLHLGRSNEAHVYLERFRDLGDLTYGAWHERMMRLTRQNDALAGRAAETRELVRAAGVLDSATV